MNILITGGTGFIGRAAARTLAGQGHHIRIATSRPQPVTVEGLEGYDCEFQTADVRLPESVAGLIAGMDAVIIAHQFKGFPIERPDQKETFHDVDALGTQNIVEAAQGAGVKKLLYLSGAAVREGLPPNPGIDAKLYAERCVRESGIDYTILRASIVYGKGDHYFGGRWLKELREKGATSVIGDGSAKSQPIFIDDLVNLIALCLTDERAKNQTLDACGPDVVTNTEVLKLLMAVTGVKGRINYLPTGIANLIAGGLKRIFLYPSLTKGLIEFSLFDNTSHGINADTRLGLSFLPLRDGLQKAFAP